MHNFKNLFFLTRNNENIYISVAYLQVLSENEIDLNKSFKKIYFFFRIKFLKLYQRYLNFMKFKFMVFD